jgi:ABC-type sugar transport system ATPase subunit
MNVFETRIRREDDRCFLEFGSQRIQAPVRQAWPNSESGETLLAGLRPESFFWPEQDSELPCIQVEVVSIEYLGHEQVVYFKSPVPTMNLREESLSEPVAQTPADNAVLAARLLNPRKVEMESHITLALDPGKMHWFDSKGQPLVSP